MEPLTVLPRHAIEPYRGSQEKLRQIAVRFTGSPHSSQSPGKVLLRNDPFHGEPLLPITPDRRTIALVGPFADSAADMLGSWPGRGDPASVVTLTSALQQHMRQSGGTLLYAKGTDADGTSDAGFEPAVRAAQQSDLVILALGESAASMTGEAASRAHLGLPGNQQQLLQAVVATGKPAVLVLFNGRPLALPWAVAHLAAIVEAWYPGVHAGPALVRTLYGDVNFSGKLPVTVPRAVGQGALYYNEGKTGRPARVHYHHDESLIASHKAHPFIIDMKLGADKIGKLLAIDARLVGNTGAYLCQGRAVITKAGTHVSGIYYCPNIKADAFAVYTNTVPCGALRGYGVPQVTFALESLMDELADRLGLGPGEVRERLAAARLQLLAARGRLEHVEDADPDGRLNLDTPVDLDVGTVPETVKVGALLSEQVVPAG